VITPRRYPFRFRSGESDLNHYAIIGMAKVLEDYPLYFDAVNEHGLAMAGLRFAESARYQKSNDHLHNVASFELIPYLLGKCRSIAEAERLLQSICITDHRFLEALPAEPLHWLLSDREGSLVIEITERGLQLHPNPANVLTNEPPFPLQWKALARHSALFPKELQEKLFSERNLSEPAPPLPGDCSSAARFVRGALVLAGAHRPASVSESVHQAFHVLGAVSQVQGCGASPLYRTLYSSCCGLESCVYYYRTYNSVEITAVRLFAEELNGAYLIIHPLREDAEIHRELPLRRF